MIYSRSQKLIDYYKKARQSKRLVTQVHFLEDSFSFQLFFDRSIKFSRFYRCYLVAKNLDLLFIDAEIDSTLLFSC